MHDMDTRNRFVEMRSKGVSLARIASRLKVSKRTLVEWNQQEQHHIRALRAVELEALREKIFLGREHEMYQLSIQLERIEEQLGKKSYEFVSMMDLFRLAAMVRGEVRKLCEPDDVAAATGVPLPTAAQSPVPAAGASASPATAVTCPATAAILTSPSGSAVGG
jgi:hypothetical protein